MGVVQPFIMEISDAMVVVKKVVRIEKSCMANILDEVCSVEVMPKTI